VSYALVASMLVCSFADVAVCRASESLGLGRFVPADDAKFDSSLADGAAVESDGLAVLSISALPSAAADESIYALVSTSTVSKAPSEPCKDNASSSGPALELDELVRFSLLSESVGTFLRVRKDRLVTGIILRIITS